MVPADLEPRVEPTLSAQQALNAARAIDAQIEAATRAAFDEGKDFIRQAVGTVDPEAEPGFTTYAVQGGPWPIDAPTPAGFIRYSRPLNWGAGK